MSDIKSQIIFPNSGLDSDSDQRYIELGSSPYRMNIIIGADSSNGTLIQILGNELAVDITDHQLTLSDTYVTVGSFYNRLTRKCYYFVCSQTYEVTPNSGDYLYDNKLFCFNEDQQNLDLIFTDQHNYLGLDVNYLMRDCVMLADWLYFNPRTSEPRMIDVVRAYNYTNYDTYDPDNAYIYGNKVTFAGGLFIANSNVSAAETPATTESKWDRIGDSYREETELDFDSEFDYCFNVIKMPPKERPIVSYASDSKINVNNVRGKLLRFSYRYEYFDKTYSVYSAYSDVTLPEDDEVYNGEILNEIATNNYLKIDVYPHSPALIKNIEIVFQEITGDWKRVKIINRQEQALLDTFSTTFDFYNNESYIVIDNTQVARIQDLVPARTNSEEIINKNILAYGGCLEGFDNIPKDEIRVGLTPVLQAIEASITPGIWLKNVYQAYPLLITQITSGGSVAWRVDLGSWYVGSGDPISDGDQLIVTIDGVTWAHLFTAGQTATKTDFIDAIVLFFLVKFPKYSTYGIIGEPNYIYIYTEPGNPRRADISQFLFATVGVASVDLTKKRGFKTGANHPFCIYYYDGSLRRWDAQVSKENIHIFGLEMHGTTVYVPMFNELSPPPDSTAYHWSIDWEVYHLPPEGAKYWRWGYAGNSLCSQFVQYIVSSIVNSNGTTEGANMTKIDITPLQTVRTTVTATWNQFPMSVIDPYVWTKGDRIRFITIGVTPGSGTDMGELVDGVYEYEILKQDNDTNCIYIQGFVETNGIDAASIGENSLAEIYNPIKSLTDTKTIYHEFGDLMNIQPDSAGIMTHQGQAGLHNQDTALSHTAMGTFDAGDVYHIMRTPSKPLDTNLTNKGAFHESQWYSDFYTSNEWDKGKIGFETSFGQRFLNIIRYSRPYFQDTEINGLSTFEEDDANEWPGYKALNDVFGDIVAIYEQGDTLKCYQERKAASILIGRTEYLDTTGKSTVATSNTVLGSIRYSPSNYSTIFPESIARNNKFLYGFDIYNGIFWRDSVNGLFPISGRYSDVGGDADYKMQTYFKLKSKALLESGIPNIDVLSAWDEEYKLLYVIFKDYANHDNNETILFHEPSNRWVSFAEFNQTPVNGYNTPLVPSPYIIVQGFEGGLGYTFNEETGFGHFDIGGGLGTTSRVYVNPGLMEIVITMPTPTITVDGGIIPTALEIDITIPTPTIHGISLSTGNMAWDADKSGETVQILETVTVIGGSQSFIQYVPDWIYLIDNVFEIPLTAGDAVVSGGEFGVYPASENTGDERIDTVLLNDGRGNVAAINVVQHAIEPAPTITVAVDPTDTTGMTLFIAMGTGANNSPVIEILFTPRNPDYGIGDVFQLTWSVNKNGVPTGDFGAFNITNRASNDEIIVLADNAISTDVIVVYLLNQPI